MAYYNHPLIAGWNNIAYLGKTLPIEQAVDSIEDVLTIVWYGDLFYAPGDSGNDLHQMVYGEAYWVFVEQSVTWVYPLPNGTPPTPPAPLGIPAPILIAGGLLIAGVVGLVVAKRRG